MRSREFITLISGAAAWPLADRMYEGRLYMAMQVIATVLLFQSWTIVAAEEAAIPSDHNLLMN